MCPDRCNGLQLQCQCSRSPQGAKSNGVAYTCRITYFVLSCRPSPGVTAVSSACLYVRIWQSVLSTGRVQGFLSLVVLCPSSVLLVRAETLLISHHCPGGVNALSHPQLGIHGRWKCLQVLLLLTYCTALRIQCPSGHDVRTALDGSS